VCSKWDAAPMEKQLVPLKWNTMDTSSINNDALPTSQTAIDYQL
jgi:hypothetical protein